MHNSYNDPYNLRAEPQPKAPPATRAPIGARPEPEGVTILDNHRRVGDTQRSIYDEHLKDLYTRGYLSKEEFEAREKAALNAETESDLNRLLADTPGLVEPRKASVLRALRSPSSLFSWLAEHKDSQALHIMGFIAWLLATITWAFVPAGLLGFYAPHQTTFQLVMVLFFVITAIASFITEIVTFVSYVEG